MTVTRGNRNRQINDGNSPCPGSEGPSLNWLSMFLAALPAASLLETMKATVQSGSEGDGCRTAVTPS